MMSSSPVTAAGDSATEFGKGTTSCIAPEDITDIASNHVKNNKDSCGGNEELKRQPNPLQQRAAKQAWSILIGFIGYRFSIEDEDETA